jgi:uncharacterized protein (DUF885 family)
MPIVRISLAAALILLSLMAKADPAADFAALVADFEAHELAHDPIQAGREGDLEAAARWPDVAPESLAARLEAEAGFSQRLAAITVDELPESDRISHAVLAYLLDHRLALAPFKAQRVGFTNDSGFFSMPLQLAGSIRPRTIAEAEAWLGRLAGLPAFLEQHRAWLERGIADGFVQPGLIAGRVLEQVQAIAGLELDEHPLMSPLDHLPRQIDASERERLAKTARELIETGARPAYVALAEFFEREYLAEPRASIGISELPDGRAYYRQLVRYHTTLDTTPEAVHQQGLAEVARIRAEMETVIEDSGFEYGFADFLEYLRSDPRFYARSERELLMHAAWIAKRADDAMPRFFRRLPRLPYGVRPVPASIAPNYTTGRYWGGDLEAGIAGGYMVNTYRLDQRPLYELPALTVHEAVPGHHHQIALAQELEDVPDFRRNTYITAFGEGWALYTEFLAIEMDIYETAYEDFGRLTYEMWRACRLVVDTGIHYFGWSQAEAEACLLENSALAPHNVRTEIERYISWPGQALAYKTGEMLIRNLRSEAEARLGLDFDLRDFHDHILSEGAMPLSALETRMRDWIEAAERARD